MTLFRRTRADALDRRLFTWPSGDDFTLRHLLQSVAIIGQIGSGKSSGSGLLLARTVLKIPRSGGLILASKPEDKSWWQARFREAGRSPDLVLFSESSPARCNVIDYEIQSGGDARSLTQFLTITSEVLDSGSGGGRSNDQFWKKSEERVLYNAIEPLRQGTGGVTAPDIQRFVSTAAYKPADLTDENWRGKFHNQVMQAAFDRPRSRIEDADAALYRDFWLNEFPVMDDKPRSSILSGVMKHASHL